MANVAIKQLGNGLRDGVSRVLAKVAGSTSTSVGCFNPPEDQNPLTLARWGTEFCYRESSDVNGRPLLGLQCPLTTFPTLPLVPKVRYLRIL